MNQDQLITFQTAKLAKEKGFKTNCMFAVNPTEHECSLDYTGEQTFSLDEMIEAESNTGIPHYLAPTKSDLQTFIREKRGVHIEIHRNASGYYWSMCKSDSGTDLGWSDHIGPNDGGVWDNFEDALENALYVQLSYDLPENTKLIKHWGNYIDFALKAINNLK